MSGLLNREHCIAGTVRFKASVPFERLAIFVTDMKAQSPERWVDLHVRKAGDDGTHYIGFHYILDDGQEMTHRKAVHKLLQYLRDQLGSRKVTGRRPDPVPTGVIGWSISTVEVVA